MSNETTFDAAKPEPPPIGEGTPIAPLVMADIEARVEAGRAKYGTLLRASNGRDALMDAYQEAIDLVMYLRQAIQERAESKYGVIDTLRARVAELEAAVSGIYEFAEVYVRALGPDMPEKRAAECVDLMNRAARAIGRAERFSITHGMLGYMEGPENETPPRPAGTPAP